MALPKSIGIRLFDDSFVPVLTEGEIKNKKVILITVKYNQKKAIIKLYEGVSDKCSQNEFLGKLVIPITRETTKGEPGLEVHLRLDDDGMLYAKAWDVESGEQTNIKIEHNSTPRIFPETLSDVEINNLDNENPDTENIPSDEDLASDDNDLLDEFAVDSDQFDDENQFDDNDDLNAADNNYEETEPVGQFEDFRDDDEFNNDSNNDSDNNYENNYENNYNQTSTTNIYEDEEPKEHNGLKIALIIIIIILLLLLLGLGIFGLIKYFSSRPPKPAPIVTTTTMKYEPAIEEEITTTTTVVRATTTTVYEAKTVGVKQVSGKSHYIRRGENLWNICKKYYGDPWYYPALAEVNHLRSPRLIRAGKTLIIPDKSELKRWDFSR